MLRRYLWPFKASHSLEWRVNREPEPKTCDLIIMTPGRPSSPACQQTLRSLQVHHTGNTQPLPYIYHFTMFMFKDNDTPEKKTKNTKKEHKRQVLYPQWQGHLSQEGTKHVFWGYLHDGDVIYLCVLHTTRGRGAGNKVTAFSLLSLLPWQPLMPASAS